MDRADAYLRKTYYDWAIRHGVDINALDDVNYHTSWIIRETNCGDMPFQFDQLDKLLMSACPAITFLQYKAMWNECVNQWCRDKGDYLVKCDVALLHEFLANNGLIPHFQE